MGSELLPSAGLTPLVDKRVRTKWSTVVILFACCALLFSWAQLSHFGGTNRQHVVPIDAQQILDECASLHTIPGIWLHAVCITTRKIC